ncbi:MAG TPA: DUF805 domain-containing protein [Devosiaceae bacterium]|jgi:uncharacterized membrane protein YhaH (DUF805 family)|nr:DUF805 domain-containing protein [Devosiaceae bacterium]
MDNIVSLYTSLDGRIGRKTWWLASIALAVVILIIEFLILPLIGLSPMANLAAVAGGDAAAASAAITDSVHKGAWVGLIVYVVFGLPIVALGVKRRHDRDNSGMDFMIFYAIALLVNLAGALGIGYTMMDVGNGITIPTPSLPLTGINVLLGLFGLYLLVVLGFLKGTTGSNQYGPDPLIVGATAAA